MSRWRGVALGAPEQQALSGPCPGSSVITPACLPEEAQVWHLDQHAPGEGGPQVER